ncbi:MAG: hypothetical protein M3Q56_00885 [Bacteroidota bacterium]|nr:hypothetical protein [Bacteroidota bacterium]
MVRGLSAMGKYDEALKYAEIALKQSPSEANTKFLTSATEKLKNKQDVN